METDPLESKSWEAALAVRRRVADKTLIKFWILGWTYFWLLGVSIPLAIVATLLLF